MEPTPRSSTISSLARHRRSAPLLAAAALAGMAAMTCACSKSKSILGTQLPEGIYPIHHSEPAWSSRGTIAYRDEGIICVSPGGGYFVDTSLVGIWVIDPVAKIKRRLIPYGGNPAWSPTGDRLSFSLSGQIMITRIDSLDYRQVTSSGQSFATTWDPGGRRIAFDSNMNNSTGTYTIFVMNVDGSGAASLGHPGSGEWRTPSWSPDGVRIAHIRFPGGSTISSEVFVMDTTGMGEVRLTTNNLTDRSPQYSPDGSLLTFSRPDPRGVPQVWLMNSTGGAERMVTNGGGSEPAWSPDGTEIVFVRENRYDNSPGNGVLWTLKLATFSEQQLTQKWAQRCP